MWRRPTGGAPSERRCRSQPQRCQGESARVIPRFSHCSLLRAYKYIHYITPTFKNLVSRNAHFARSMATLRCTRQPGADTVAAFAHCAHCPHDPQQADRQRTNRSRLRAPSRRPRDHCTVRYSAHETLAAFRRCIWPPRTAITRAVARFC